MEPREPQFEKEAPKEKPNEIKDASTYEELYDILDAKKEIIGSGGKRYSAEGLKNKIKALRNSKDNLTPDKDGLILFKFFPSTIIESITRTEGLREKAIELFQKQLKEEEDLE